MYGLLSISGSTLLQRNGAQSETSLRASVQHIDATIACVDAIAGTVFLITFLANLKSIVNGNPYSFACAFAKSTTSNINSSLSSSNIFSSFSNLSFTTPCPKMTQCSGFLGFVAAEQNAYLDGSVNIFLMHSMHAL